MASINGRRILPVSAQPDLRQSSLDKRDCADADFASGPAWCSPWFAGKSWGTLLCAAYPLLILFPLLVFVVARPANEDMPVVNVAVNCAVVAFSIFAMQFLLTARFRWIEAPFGLDVILRFHQGMALVSVCLLCAHPLLLASAHGWGLLTHWGARWPIWAGRLALLILLTHGAVAMGRRVLRLPYETWLFLHNAGAFLVLGLALVHSLAVGGDFSSAAPRIVWISLALVAWTAWFFRRVGRPYLLARRPYKVLAVYRETPGVWTLILEPPVGQRLVFAPGQFQFLRPLTGSVLAEEHPFSFASAPSPDGRIGITIKESGNFTSTIGKLAPDDLVTVHGPFGRFSHVLHADSGELVFIAAGVGITPLMSMLRHMHDCRDSRRVLLVYANHDASAIVFRQELEDLELDGFPRLRVVHVVSHALDDWRVLPGRLDAGLLHAICRDLTGKAFFICCPPRMTASLISGLRRAGVASSKIHADCFGL